MGFELNCASIETAAAISGLVLVARNKSEPIISW